jgi:predicted nucleotide-binding protein
LTISSADVAMLSELLTEGQAILATRQSANHGSPAGMIAIGFPDRVDASKSSRWLPKVKLTLARMFGADHQLAASIEAIQTPLTFPTAQRAFGILDAAHGEATRILAEVSPSVTNQKPPQDDLAASVFIVHGHDSAKLEEVKRFIEKLGLEVTVLKEQPNGGKTVIEKFEEHANTSTFGVAILTPDDVGKKDGEVGNLRLRARQNVIFELGYFFGKLGRGRVVALTSGDLELPSDIVGLATISLVQDWKRQLAKEVRAAGIKVDLNALIDD